MTIIDIENMTAAELKAKRDEAVTAAGGGEVAARYVQARLDAKLRDEKLAEQGATITSLNAAVDSLASQLAAVKQQAEKTASELALRHDALVQTSQKVQAEIAARQQDAANAQASIDQIAKELNHFRVLAESRRKALADVMNFAGQLNAKVAPLLAE